MGKTAFHLSETMQEETRMENVTDRVEFEKKVVVDGNTKRIDVYIPETHSRSKSERGNH